MWIPEGADEIERLAQAGELEETPFFDAKAQLPENKKKNVDLVIDVAAMSTDGGVLLYGVGEDDTGAPRVLRPFELAGARERVDQIVTTSIAEPPTVQVRAYPRSEDPSTGYLAIIVPRSPRAPHQVAVRENFRFYGRGATGNRILTEAEVARLYERRRSWEVDRDAYLDRVVSESAVRNIGGATGYGVMHAFVRPVAADPDLLARWLRIRGGELPVQWFMNQAARSALGSTFSPTLTRPHRWRQYDADSWRLSTDDSDGRRDLTSIIDLDVFSDGSMRLMCGRATDAVADSDRPWFFESIVAGVLDQFAITAGALLTEAGYHGAIDVGLEVAGIEGSISALSAQRHDGTTPYRSPRYRRTTRVSAAELGEPKTIADSLISPLIRAVSGYTELDIWDFYRRDR